MPWTPSPADAADGTRRHRNARLGLGLVVFVLAVFAVTLWKFRPF